MNDNHLSSLNSRISTYLKYKWLLNRFMRVSYNLPIEYSKKLDFIQIISSQEPDQWRVTNNQVVTAYKQLIKIKMYDDALLIQLLYSLSISPAYLSLL